MERLRKAGVEAKNQAESLIHSTERQLAELRGEAVSPPAASFFARLKGSGRSIPGFHLRDALDLHLGDLVRGAVDRFRHARDSARAR